MDSTTHVEEAKKELARYAYKLARFGVRYWIPIDEEWL